MGLVLPGPVGAALADALGVADDPVAVVAEATSGWTVVGDVVAEAAALVWSAVAVVSEVVSGAPVLVVAPVAVASGELARRTATRARITAATPPAAASGQ